MSEKGPSQATRLVQYALETAELELFRTPSLDAYVMLPAGTHRECHPVRSAAFRRWLSRLYFLHAKVAPGGQALTDALSVLEGRALFEGLEQEVHLRLASDDDGTVWLDLGDEHWRAIRITGDGWEVVHDPPVRFRRARGMLPLPYPVKGGSHDELRPFVNVDDSDWPLFLGWLAGALRPRGPYAVLLVHGEQGSAKSTLVRVARLLLDPNEAPVRREPRNAQDLIVAARNGLVVAFDNVSHLSGELSDDLARIATGSGFGARQLWTDMDEVIVQVSRPIVLNGIEEVAVRGDLLDRGLILNLPRINRYQDEDTFWTRFSEAHPRILGALLDAISTAVANHPTTRTPNVRMADFARWVAAAEPALGLERDAFLTAYRANRSRAVQSTLESSLLSQPVMALATSGFSGTATDLLRRLNALVSDETRKQKEWPKQPHTLSGRLRRLAPAMRKVGVEIEFERTSARDRTRTIHIRPLVEIGERASEASEASETASPVASAGRSMAAPSVREASGASESVQDKGLDQGVRTLVDASDALLHDSTNGSQDAEVERLAARCREWGA